MVYHVNFFDSRGNIYFDIIDDNYVYIITLCDYYHTLYHMSYSVEVIHE